MTDRSFFRMLLCAVLVAVFAAGCASDEVAVRLDEPTETTLPSSTVSPSSSSSSSTTASSVTSTSTSSTTSAAPEPGVAELTWAEDGTVEAAVERAFWPAYQAGLDIYREDIRDPNYQPFVSRYTGRDLERITTEVANLDAGEFYRYPEESDIVIEFIAPVTDTEMLIQLCVLNRGEYYVNGELSDDRDIDSNFQARFVLVDGQWLWEQTIKLKFEYLEGDQPTCMSASST